MRVVRVPFRCSTNKKVSAITIATLPSEMRTSLGRNLTYGMLDVIGRAIVIGDYDNVAFPTEAELARKHGVSRAVTREAVKMRNHLNKKILLECSGNVKLATVRQYAATGAERISVGALTHTIEPLDIGLDFAFKA